MLERLAQRFIKTGRLRIIYPNGRIGAYGDGAGPEVAVRLTGRLTLLRIALQPALAIGECYMDGSLTMAAR